MLAPRFPALRLVLAGSGDIGLWRREAQARGIGERVELPGWLDAAARDAQLARAAVFCLPSHAEGLPMSLLEAMASGCASVASAVGGIPEALKDGENGLLVPPRDAHGAGRRAGPGTGGRRPARAPGKHGAHDSGTALFDGRGMRPVGGNL